MRDGPRILRGPSRRGITTDTALRLQKVLGPSAQLWLKLQQNVELRDALHSDELRGEIGTLIAGTRLALLSGRSSPRTPVRARIGNHTNPQFRNSARCAVKHFKRERRSETLDMSDPAEFGRNGDRIGRNVLSNLHRSTNDRRRGRCGFLVPFARLQSYARWQSCYLPRRPQRVATILVTVRTPYVRTITEFIARCRQNVSSSVRQDTRADALDTWLITSSR